MKTSVLYLFSCIIVCFSLTRAESSSKSVQLDSLPLICKKQCAQFMNGTQTELNCQTPDRSIQGRCCVISKEGTVVGIDLQKCEISETVFSDGVKDMTDLLYISLQGNDIEEIKSEDFHRNTKIVYLSLPQHLDCPGGKESWNKTHNSTEKFVECIGELDFCKVHNVTCPENSHCVPSGINQIECLCDEGYHGYKCMNQGTFPTVAFVIGLAVPTVVLSALLWVTQRRYVKTSNKNK